MCACVPARVVRVVRVVRVWCVWFMLFFSVFFNVVKCCTYGKKSLAKSLFLFNHAEICFQNAAKPLLYF